MWELVNSNSDNYSKEQDRKRINPISQSPGVLCLEVQARARAARPTLYIQAGAELGDWARSEQFRA